MQEALGLGRVEALARELDRRLEQLRPRHAPEAAMRLLEPRDEPGHGDGALTDLVALRRVAEVDREVIDLAQGAGRRGEEGVEQGHLALDPAEEEAAASRPGQRAFGNGRREGSREARIERRFRPLRARARRPRRSGGLPAAIAPCMKVRVSRCCTDADTGTGHHQLPGYVVRRCISTLSWGNVHLAVFLGSVAALIALAVTPQLLGDRVGAGVEGLSDASPGWIWIAGSGLRRLDGDTRSGWRSALTRCGGSTSRSGCGCALLHRLGRERDGARHGSGRRCVGLFSARSRTKGGSGR